MATTNEKVTYTYTADTAQMNSNLNQSSGIMGILSSKAVLVGGAIAGVGAAAFKSADMASDLNEAMNVVTATFGEAGNEMIAWSENSIEAMGISQTQALKTAGTFGTMAQSMGLSTSESMNMAESLTQLSADMASFYNVSQETAALALKGVFTGETESLKQFGIMIDETTLKQYGYNSSMSQAEKIQIRYKAVMDQTTSAQGDFANTSDGLANQIRILSEQFKQLVTIIGGFLMPVINSVIRLLNEGLSTAIAVLNGNTEGLSGSFGQLASFLSAYIVPVLAQIKEAFIAVAQALMPIIQEIASLLIPIMQRLVPIVSMVAQAFWQIVTVVANALAPVIDKLVIIFDQLLLALTPVIDALINLLAPVLKVIVDIVTIVVTVFAKLASLLLSILMPIIFKLANILSAILTPIIEFLTAVLEKLHSVLSVVITIMQNMAQVTQFALSVALEVLKNTLDRINIVLDFFKSIMEQTKERAQALADIISNVLKQAFEIIKAPIEAVNNIIQRFIDLISTAIGRVQDFANNVTSALGNLPFIGNSAVVVQGAPTSAQGFAGASTNNATYNYNIHTDKKPTLRELKRQQFIFKNIGGSYVS